MSEVRRVCMCERLEGSAGTAVKGAGTRSSEPSS